MSAEAEADTRGDRAGGRRANGELRSCLRIRDRVAARRAGRQPGQLVAVQVQSVQLGTALPVADRVTRYRPRTQVLQPVCPHVVIGSRRCQVVQMTLALRQRIAGNGLWSQSLYSMCRRRRVNTQWESIR